MKRILIIGVGAQGSTIAKRMDEEPNVKEIICADYDEKAANELVSLIKKGTAVQVDATKFENITRIAEGVDLIVNGLPLELSEKILKAALSVGSNYQDMAAGVWENMDWVDSIQFMINDLSKQFEANGRTALISTGSAPGLANVITRESVDQLDRCHKIGIYVYEGVWSKKFIPFWWSPEVAFSDMGEEAYCYENGEIKELASFSRPVMMKFKGIANEIRMVEHAHDEPVTMGILADRYLKGAKEICFKYGGCGIEFAEPFYKMGLLSKKPVMVNGTQVVPLNLVTSLSPRAPKYHDEIQAIIDEGMEKEEAAFLVRVEGEQNGKAVRIDNYVDSPGLEEAFSKSGLTHESYLTGQSASLFTKMFVNDRIKIKGLYPPEVLDAEERGYYLKEAKKLGITVTSSKEDL